MGVAAEATGWAWRRKDSVGVAAEAVGVGVAAEATGVGVTVTAEGRGWAWWLKGVGLG